jgi:glycosyltransferase involved in cell wall biosynthesis
MKSTNLYFFTLKNTSFEYGVGTYIKNLVNKLEQYKSYNVYLIYCLDDIQDVFKIQSLINVTEIHIPQPRTRFINLYSLKKDKYVTRYCHRICDLMTQFFNDGRQNIVHINQASLSPLVEALKQRFKTKVIFTFHSLSWHFLYENDFISYSEAFKECNDKSNHVKSIDKNEAVMCSLSDAIICLNSYSSDFICEAYLVDDKKITIIKNGIDPVLAIEKESRKSIRSKLGFNDDHFIILYVGRLVKTKGIHYLIDAFDKYVNQHNVKDAKLVIVGSGYYDSVIGATNNIWNNIVWTGQLSSHHLRELYNIADIGITTSFFEQCSYTAIEMLHYGIPVIYTNTCGLNEMFNDNYNGLGYLIDTDSICKHFHFLQSNPSERERLKRGARKSAINKFNSKTWLKCTTDLYNKLSN